MNSGGALVQYSFTLAEYCEVPLLHKFRIN